MFTSAKNTALSLSSFYCFFCIVWSLLSFFALVECGTVYAMAYIHWDRCGKTASNMRKRMKEAGIQR